MPDFLLEIGCEEIPARMIDAASLELRERVHEAAGPRTACCPRAPSDLSRYAAPPGRSGGEYSCRAARCHRAGDRAVGERRLQRWPAHSGRACLRQESRRGCFPTGTQSQRRRASTFPRKSRRKGAPRRDSGRSSCPKKSLPSTGPRTCTGASRASASCARCAGWWPCSTREVIPLEFDGVRAGNQSRGHRILADGSVAIPRAGASYVEALETAKVLSRERTREADSQSSRRRDAHHSRRALARRQSRCSIRWSI